MRVYLWVGFCGSESGGLHRRSSSGANKVSCQGIQSKVFGGLREGQDEMYKISVQAEMIELLGSSLPKILSVYIPLQGELRG